MKKTILLQGLGGKRGIRTPGPVKINGFQDRRIRPLCHLSEYVRLNRVKSRQKYDLISKFATPRVAISLLRALFLLPQRRSGSRRSEIAPSPSPAGR